MKNEKNNETKNEKTNVIKNEKRKTFPYRVLKDEKFLTCTIHIIYNSDRDKIYIVPTFRYGASNVRLGFSSGWTLKDSYVPDEEVKSNIKRLVENNWYITSTEIAKKTGYSLTRVTQFYMSIKRKIGGVKNTKQSI